MDKVTRQFRLQQWAEALRDHKESGLTVMEWCRLHNVSKYQFYYRQREVSAFCAAQWQPVRLPVATRRCQWPGLISHFSFNHNDVVFRHPLEQRVG